MKFRVIARATVEVEQVFECASPEDAEREFQAEPASQQPLRVFPLVVEVRRILDDDKDVFPDPPYVPLRLRK